MLFSPFNISQFYKLIFDFNKNDIKKVELMDEMPEVTLLDRKQMHPE